MDDTASRDVVGAPMHDMLALLLVQEHTEGETPLAKQYHICLAAAGQSR
ncbi:MAG: hypothetical protein QOF51_2552 [Chloroflexota bacterium]|nr:hypothetical protein [Chloroflexota bacterium]